MTLISSGSVSPLAQVYTDVFPVVGQHEYTAPRMCPDCTYAEIM